MSKTIKSRGASSKPRKSAHAGNHRQGKGRPGSKRTGPQAPRILANSIFALTAKPKPGVEVITKIGNGRTRSELVDDYDRMYCDLFAIAKHAVKLVTGEATAFDPRKEGWEIGACLGYVIRIFKNNVLPANWQYNIDREYKGRYYFTIYKDCDFDAYWHCFAVKPFVKYLVNYHELHTLYLELMRSMMVKAHICPWWSGGLDYADYMVEEQIENWDEQNFEDEEESDKELYKAMACVESYKTGETKKYEELLRQCKPHSPEYLLEKLKSVKSRSPKLKAIVGWMKQACQFLQIPGGINDFIYEQMEEDREMEGVRFYSQVSVLWEEGDTYSNYQLECLDSEAQGCGLMVPVLNYAITLKTKKIDVQDLEERTKWPEKLTQLHRDYDLVISKFFNK